MVTTKRAAYANHRDELDAEGITYVPVVWSAYGRPHPDAVRVLVTLAGCTARRRGTSDASTLARRTAARIAAAIWRRAALVRPARSRCRFLGGCSAAAALGG